MAVGLVYTVTLKGNAYGVDILNVFTYRSEQTNATAVTLADNFVADVWPSIKGILSGAYYAQTVVAQAVDSDTDFHQVAFPNNTTGDILEASTPSWVGLQFISPTKNKSIRQGRKCFAPVGESWTLNNEYAPSTGHDNAMQACADALSADIVQSSVVQFKPIIVKRIKTIVGGKPVYKLPSNTGYTAYYVADNWTWDIRLGGQNTRKR